jgi:phosphoadenosine phosphosulfate reductase
MQTLPLPSTDVEELAEFFEDRPAEEVLEWALERFAGRILITCSWQRQSSVLVHMLHTMDADVRVVELDTGLLFPETYETRQRLVERYGLRLERIDPLQTVAEQAESEGAELWRRNPDRCCWLRKVEPLERALVGMDGWITGIRRAQGGRRADARKLELDRERGVVKIQPLADWTDEEVQDYLDVNEIPYNPLHDNGYPSIGCMPCTRAVRDGEDPRAGRWQDFGKRECGLHLPPSPPPARTQ